LLLPGLSIKSLKIKNDENTLIQIYINIGRYIVQIYINMRRYTVDVIMLY